MKKTKDQKLDDRSRAALEIVEFERKRAEFEQAERERREKLLAEAYEMAGRIQGARVVGIFADVSAVLWLKQIKESKAYKIIGTWETFCNHCGFSRPYADESLNNLEVLGDKFLLTCQRFCLSYRDLRKLRKLTSEGAIAFDKNTVNIAGERIPLNPEHREDLELAIEQVIEEKDARLRTKDKLIDQKQRLIEKQQKAMVDLELKIDHMEEISKNFYPEDERDFLKRAEEWKLMADAWLIKFNPEVNPLPRRSSVVKRTAVLEILAHFARVSYDIYRNALDIYGVAEVDDPCDMPGLITVESMTDEILAKKGDFSPENGGITTE